MVISPIVSHSCQCYYNSLKPPKVPLPQLLNPKLHSEALRRCRRCRSRRASGQSVSSEDLGLLGGSWVVISGVVSKVTVVITHIRGLLTILP